MAALCLLSGGVVAAVLALDTFTLAWTHSVEKIGWREDWRIADGRLVLEAAAVEGSGAGVDPPPGAVRDGRFWRWRPALPPLAELVLARSEVTADWRLCWNGACRPLAELVEPAPTPLRLRPCDDGTARSSG